MGLPEQSCCTFCNNLLRRTSTAPWDTIVEETENFILSPTKGSLLPGWLLIVAKRHAICSGALSTKEREDLAGAIALAKLLVRRNFGPPTIFEHGPTRSGTSLGCGIDHMHFHVAPLPFSLIESVNALVPNIQWLSIDGIADLRALYHAQTAYAVVQEDEGLLNWCRPPVHMRQMFRQAIAHKLGIPDRYDYAAHPEPSNVELTIRRVSVGI